MYVALWKVLPGPLWARILIVVSGALAVLAALVFFLFPWVDRVLTQSVVVAS
ncbi:MAG: hypothetical protein K9H50_00685 [Aurantimicrobium sp.]|nr:hypothetical protein [Aurantimicrobium sp.]